MGASSALVRLTVRMRPFCRSSLEDDTTSCVVGGVDDRDRLMRTPCGGDAALFDIFVGCWT